MMGVLNWLKNILPEKSPPIESPKNEQIATSVELSEFILKGGSNQSLSGEMITPGTAMRLGAVNACVKVISETMASLPLVTYRRDLVDPRIKNKALDHFLYNLLFIQPNRWQTAFEFREMMETNKLLRGNAYAVIIRRGKEITELIPIPPDRVDVKQNEDFSLTYKVRMRDGRSQLEFSQRGIFHLKGLSTNGYTGIPPLQVARETIGLGLATQRHGATLFGNGAFPSGVLTHPKHLKEEGFKNLKEQWEKQVAGDMKNSTAILEEGMEWKQTTMTQEDAQFLETREFNRSEIAAIFRCPPHKIGDLKRATFSNIEAQETSFVRDTVMPRCVSWEQTIWRDLIPKSDKAEIFVKYLIEGLLRGDTKARTLFYKEMVLMGAFNPNEVRELEDRNPREGGDEYLKPLNMDGGNEDTSDEGDQEPGRESNQT